MDTRDTLGTWKGTGGEGAKFWLRVLTESKNRGTDDVCIVVCDGLKALGEAIEATWPLAVVQPCVLHLIRNTFRLASRRGLGQAGLHRADRAGGQETAQRLRRDLG